MSTFLKTISYGNKTSLHNSKIKEIVIDLKLIIKAINYIISFKKLKIPYTKYQGKKSTPKIKIKEILKKQGKFFDKLINTIKLEIINESLIKLIYLKNVCKKLNINI